MAKKNNLSIDMIIEHIAQQAGVTTVACDSFPGFHRRGGRVSVNLILKDPVWLSADFHKIKQLCANSSLISDVGPCGGNNRICVDIRQ